MNREAIALPSLKKDSKLPVILNRKELKELFAAPTLLKQRVVPTAQSPIYYVPNFIHSFIHSFALLHPYYGGVFLLFPLFSPTSCICKIPNVT